MSNNVEQKRKRIEKHGFKVSRVRSSAHPEGLYVARKGNFAFYEASTIGGLHKKIFGY